MTQTITLFGHDFIFAPTPLQRRFAGRLVCVLIAAPMITLTLLPFLLQAAQM